MLDVARRDRKLELYANDLDPDVAAFWKVMASDDVSIDLLCERLDVVPTLELFDKIRSEPASDLVGRAFAAVIRNRCAFSGYLTGGPLGGRTQTGKMKIFSRYNKEKVIEAVAEAHRLLSGRLQVFSVDGINFVRRHAKKPLFCDPPYSSMISR